MREGQRPNCGRDLDIMKLSAVDNALYIGVSTKKIGERIARASKFNDSLFETRKLLAPSMWPVNDDAQCGVRTCRPGGVKW